MTHALADPACDCRCHLSCGPPLHADTAGAAAALHAAEIVEGDPYPFLIHGRDLPLWQQPEHTCGLCGRTVRGPLLPIITGEGPRMVGTGCARKHADDRRRRPDNLLPLPLEGEDRV